MTDVKHLYAVSSMVDSLKLNDKEVEEIYQLMGNMEIDKFLQQLQDFGETIPKDADEVTLLEWLKTLKQKSPKAYDALQQIIKENKPLFDKIQDIFIEKLL